MRIPSYATFIASSPARQWRTMRELVDTYLFGFGGLDSTAARYLADHDDDDPVRDRAGDVRELAADLRELADLLDGVTHDAVREQAGRDRLRALQDTTGRTPEEAALYLAKARELEATR